MPAELRDADRRGRLPQMPAQDVFLVNRTPEVRSEHGIFGPGEPAQRLHGLERLDHETSHRQIPPARRALDRPPVSEIPLLAYRNVESWNRLAIRDERISRQVYSLPAQPANLGDVHAGEARAEHHSA